MAIVHKSQGFQSSPWGPRWLRALLIGNLFVYTLLSAFFWRFTWHAQKSAALMRDGTAISVDTSPATPQNDRHAGLNGWVFVPPKIPASGRDDLTYRSVRARVKRREAALNRARMRYLEVRRQVALGKLAEKDALRARNRVEEASMTLQAEKDLLASLQLSRQYR